MRLDWQFRRLVHDVVMDDRNLRGVAALADMPYSTLAEQINPNSRPLKKLDAGLLPALVTGVSGGKRLVRYLAEQAGMVCVDLPDVESGGAPARKLAESVREFGDLLASHGQAMEDGEITPAERKRLRREGLEAVAAIHGYLLALDAEE
ncbi:MAG: hypothetical protein KQJ78_24010 [Deltaproteobacteria bacterium]|nr:hypothetical protein [Deltaproteobacteria bacterium]